MSESIQRREKLFSQMKKNSLALITSGEEQIRNRDVEYPFRASSDFFYLTGFTEPDSILVLLKKEGKQQTIIFVRPKDKKQEIWQGKRLGVKKAINTLAVDQAFSIDEFDEKMIELIEGVKNIYISFTQLSHWSENISEWIGSQKSKARQGVTPTNKLLDVDVLLHEARLIKSSAEIKIIRTAAQISVQGHLAALKATSFNYEYEVQAAVEGRFMELGSPRVAFSSIVASGKNACILHYTENREKLQNESLILVDAGAEYQGYAGDITSTFPKSGKFSLAQKELYDLVLKAQQAVIALIKPNVRYDKLHKCSEKIMTQGLLDLGVLKGDYKKLLKKKAYKRYFMHGTGHWLGMDVHDVGDYKVKGKWRKLKPGMVLTVEPGIYISSEEGKKKLLDKKYWNIGIRIEDDILVTDKGNEVLSTGLPRTTSEIENYMKLESIVC